MVNELLDAEDKAVINQLLENNAALEENLRKAKAAGLDTADLEERLAKSIAKLRAIKSSFFPNE